MIFLGTGVHLGAGVFLISGAITPVKFCVLFVLKTTNSFLLAFHNNFISNLFFYQIENKV